MTAKQPHHRDWLVNNVSAGYVLDDHDCCELRAALADLDACRAALFVVEWQASGYDGAQTVATCPWCHWANPDHAPGCGLAAVLAAAGEERP